QRAGAEIVPTTKHCMSIGGMVRPRAGRPKPKVPLETFWNRRAFQGTRSHALRPKWPRRPDVHLSYVANCAARNPLSDGRGSGYVGETKQVSGACRFAGRVPDNPDLL